MSTPTPRTVHPAETSGSRAALPGRTPLTTKEAAYPCRRHKPDLWFAESPEDVEVAKALCGPCPIRQACLSGALERREPWGVWGAELVLDGVVVARKRGRGRPRKDRRAA